MEGFAGWLWVASQAAIQLQSGVGSSLRFFSLYPPYIKADMDDYLYWLRSRNSIWAGVLVCGYRSQMGTEETPPTRRIAVPNGTS